MSSGAPYPRLRDLDSALSGLPWSDIKRMAIHLHDTFTLPVLDKIGEDRSTAGERLLYCMEKWLDGDVNACWRKVVVALREIGKYPLANDLESRYWGGCGGNSLNCTSSVLTYGEPRTQPQALQAPPVRDTANPSEAITFPSVEEPTCKHTDKLQRVVKEFLDLEEQFVSLVTHVQFYLSVEIESPKLLGRFRLTLMNLPMSRKFKHMHFLEEKKELIKATQDIIKIFNILRPYWNHVDYSLLEHITMEFGSQEIKKRVKVYISSLTQFEKETTIQIFVDTTCDDREIPPKFSEVIIKLDRSQLECSLYDIRKFKESLACRSSLCVYSVQIKRVGAGSIVMVLAIPRDGIDMFMKTADDFQYKLGSNILSMGRANVTVESELHTFVCHKSAVATVEPSAYDAQPFKDLGDYISQNQQFHSSLLKEKYVALEDRIVDLETRIKMLKRGGQQGVVELKQEAGEQQELLAVFQKNVDTSYEEKAKLRQELKEKDMALEEREMKISELEARIRVLERGGQQGVVETGRGGGVECGTRDLSMLRWEVIERAPVNLSAGSAVVIGDDLYVASDTTRTVYCYNSLHKWTTLAECRCKSFSLAAVDNMLVTVGGYDGEYTNKLYNYISHGRLWNDELPAMPTARREPITLSTAQYLIVAGGFSGTRSLATIDVMTIADKKWTTCETPLPHLVSGGSMTFCNNQLYLAPRDVDSVNNQQLFLTCSLADIFKSPKKKFLSKYPGHWQEARDLPAPLCSVVSVNGQLLAIGGKNNQNAPTYTNNSVWEFNPTTNSWKVMTHMNVGRWTAITASLPRNRLIVVGGQVNWKETNTVEIASF